MSVRHTVSVVVPSYNASEWIEEALGSVLAQTHPVLEVLVVDDGSNDGTPEIVQRYGRGVKLLQEAHRGVPQRNRGIAESRGQFVAFLDADDFWKPLKIEKQLGAIARDGTEWVICEADWLDSSTGRIGRAGGSPVREGDILESLLGGNFIVTSTALVSRRALESVGPFEESRRVMPGEDWDLWLRLAARYRVSAVREELCTLRLHQSSLMTEITVDNAVLGQENVIRRAVESNTVRLGHLRRPAFANVYYSTAVRLFRQGRLGPARTYFWRAWTHNSRLLQALAYFAITFLGQSTAVMLRRIRHLQGARE